MACFIIAIFSILFNCINIDLIFFDNNLININLSSLDRINIVKMNDIFYNCNNLANIDLLSFDTKNTPNMGNLLYG